MINFRAFKKFQKRLKINDITQKLRTLEKSITRTMWPGYAGTTMNLKIFLKENLNNQYLNQATQKKP